MAFRAPGRMHSLSGRVCLKESGAKVEHLGLLHSHPQWKKSRKDNDLFSPGDAVVSVLSGKIYLTTPHGEVYALDRKKAWLPLVSGVLAEGPYWINQLAQKLNIGLPERSEESEKLYQMIKKLDQHISPGSNYETFDINTYRGTK